MYCPICGGATTCPAGDTIVPVRLSDIRQIYTGDPVPAGWVVTHRNLRYRIAVPAGATIVGTAKSDRIVAHNPHLRRVWVGACSYAFTQDEA
mgnify:CR=1 FL=1